jgi:hypothetical protein
MEGAGHALIPAETFKNVFDAVFKALKAASKDVHGRASDNNFLVSHLKIGSSEFGFSESHNVGDTLSSSIALFKQAAQAVAHSEFSFASEHQSLAKSLGNLGAKIDTRYSVIAVFGNGEEIPFDDFFCSQARRLVTLERDKKTSTLFAGSAIGTFDGRLGDIDYRGSTWKGHLLLHGSSVEIECTFDKSKGEDVYNQFGNKRVSITGRAIYTGDSHLPERIEVIQIREIPLAAEYRDLRGSMRNSEFGGFKLD